MPKNNMSQKVLEMFTRGYYNQIPREKNAFRVSSDILHAYTAIPLNRQQRWQIPSLTVKKNQPGLPVYRRNIIIPIKPVITV